MVHSETIVANATSFGCVTKIKEKKTTTKREGKTGAGSRRIFSPVFKLQVLNSYRTDADCQGNQRATARKYGIHRRQIQKWLQMEETLRTSVRQQQQQVNVTSAAAVTPPPSSSILNLTANNRVVLKTPPPLPLTESAEKASSKRLPVEKDQPSRTETAADAAESEEYVNVDEISDSEDDSSSCSSLAKGWSSGDDRALDFTNATLSKRRFYSDEFKSHVLREFRNGDSSCRGNQRATARKFGIHRRQVQKWLDRDNAVTSSSSSSSSSTSSSPPSPPRADHFRRLGCLDLSSITATTTKRKSQTPEIEPEAKRPTIAVVQETALCLVKDENHNGKLPNKTVGQQLPATAVSPPYPCPLEHSTAAVVNYSSYLRPEYSLPFCVYQQPPPWSCCVAAAAASPSVRSNLDSIGGGGGLIMPKYSSYSLNLKYETSYVDIPVQYGFGDSVPSKWLKQCHPPPFYPHEYPSIQLLSSYR